jgi:hypothetical protein
MFSGYSLSGISAPTKSGAAREIRSLDPPAIVFTIRAIVLHSHVQPLHEEWEEVAIMPTTTCQDTRGGNRRDENDELRQKRHVQHPHVRAS